MSEAILLSGGIDSAALAFHKKPKYSITINYGQKAAQAELRAAKKIAEYLDLKHEVIEIDASSLGSGLMSSRPTLKSSHASEWWPFRNQLLITLAASRSIELGVKKIYFGTVSTDKQHKDGTKEFFEAMDKVLSCQEGEIHLEAPAIHLDSMGLVKASGAPLELLGWTYSCHTGNSACGVCKGCEKHNQVLADLYRGDASH